MGTKILLDLLRSMRCYESHHLVSLANYEMYSRQEMTTSSFKDSIMSAAISNDHHQARADIPRGPKNHPLPLSFPGGLLLHPNDDCYPEKAFLISFHAIPFPL